MPFVLLLGAIIIAMGVGAYIIMPQDTPTVPTPTPVATTPTTAPTTPTTPTPTPTESPEATLPTGTFTAESSYLTPRRDEHKVVVSLTLDNGVVTASEVLFDGKPAGENSNSNQGRFYDAYQSEVIGKALTDISLARVGGASLTSTAFNEAVAKIAAETGA